MLIDATEVQIFALAIASAAGLIVAAHIARLMGRFLNFRTLLLLNYILVTSVSGIAHLTTDGASRIGYHDVRGIDSAQAATVSTCVGLVALCCALLHRVPKGRASKERVGSSFLLSSRERHFLFYLSLLLLPLTIWSTVVIQNYAIQLDSERIVAIEGGMARYSYVAKWFAWAASFATIWLIGTRLGRNRLFASLVAAICVLSIVASIAWSGGRSIILVMVFPVVLVLLPRLRGLTWILWPIGLAALANYIIKLSELRGGSADSLSLRAWTDWQWGRFSMMGWAHEQVEENGFLLGETFASAGATLLGGIVGLIGVSLGQPSWLSSTQIAGADIRGDNTTWIVPGLNAELFMNFGLVGVALGLYALGRFTNWVDQKYATASSITIRLTFAYIGTLLVLRSVPSDSASIPTYLLYIGNPLLLAGLYSHIMHRKLTRTPVAKSIAYADQISSDRSRQLAN
ncbi:Uncharacterised protein [Kocuria rosea]|nr:Uncharacterised protein [Kocuria rosea]